MDSAFAKGVKAAKQGKSPEDCPYEDKLTAHGRPTFMRAFRNCWLAGYKAAKDAQWESPK